uniref:F-box domain-containing protein n=1 Tax=Dunaliella tertiolecta TaxID=3047 RepID=A0A7S3VQ53_DUNTE
MASLLSLPDDLLGHIFSMLETCEEDGRDCRRSFLSCCKTLRASKSIHSQFSTLTISADQLSRSSSSSSSASQHSSNPFLCFPRGAQLKTLVLQEGEGDSAPNAGNQLLKLLQPMSSDAHLRVVAVLRDLEEIQIEVGWTWRITLVRPRGRN